jgi:hypothetical protein
MLSPSINVIQSPIQGLDREVRVSELIDDNTKWWNSELINQIFTVEDAARICGLPLRPNLQSDTLVWA